MNNNVLNNIVSATAGALVGGGLTYVVVNKILKKRYEAWANEQIQEVRAYYKELNEQQYGDPSPSELVSIKEEDVLTALEDMRDRAEQRDGYVDYTKPIVLNAFNDRALKVDEEGIVIQKQTDEEDEPSYEQTYEIIPGEPFLITQSEYINGDDYEKTNMKYYALDDVLVDSDGEVVQDVQYAVGERHIHMFGWGSADKNLVYVRNDKTELDMEIVELEAEYVVAVLGMPSNLSDETRVSRRKHLKLGDD